MSSCSSASSAAALLGALGNRSSIGVQNPDEQERPLGLASEAALHGWRPLGLASSFAKASKDKSSFAKATEDRSEAALHGGTTSLHP
jgi:hypothetical protein